MIKKLTSSLLLASGFGLACISAQAVVVVPQANMANGQQIAEQQCAACHGVDGVSVVPTQPNLGGQGIKYLYKQLIDYKTGDRVNGIMQAQVAPLNQQDMADVSAYYASQAPWGVFAGDPATTEEAQRLYLGGDKTRGVISCAGCHDPKGLGNDWAVFPRLSGQHAQYLSIQLKMFRAAGREDDVAQDQMRMNDPSESGMMRSVAARLTDRDIRILSDFLSAVH